MMMSDTCTTHRSRVPRRSSGRIKGGVTTVQDERGPGLDFSLCFVCGSRPWGAAALLLCLFMLLKSVECSPVPASFFPFYELCYIGAETREEGGTCCQKKPSLLGGIAVLRRSGSRKKEAGTGEHSTDFNNINKHKSKAAAPHGRLPHTKHKLKSRPGPLSSCTVVTPPFILPELLRGTRDRWVVQVLLIIINSTSLAPFPRLSAPPHSSHTPIAPRRPGGTPETALYSPPSLGGADHSGRGVPGGKDRRGERKGDGRMRRDRYERGERGKKIK